MRRTGPLLVLLTVLTVSACEPPEGPEGPAGSGCDPTSFDLTAELTSPAAEALLQLNCYRQRMGANLAHLDGSLSEAARLHAEYLDATGGWGHAETDTSIDSYRGESPEERATAAGFVIDDNLQSISELIGFHEGGADASNTVDLWFDTVYHRLPLTIPSLEAVGFGSAGIYDIMLVVSPWEATFSDPEYLSHTYPVPGQSAVPRSFDSDREVPDPDPERGEIGFPISVSFLDQSFVDPGDLYGMTVDESVTGLWDSEGDEIETGLLTPQTDDLIRRSVVLIPLEPLAPETSYSATLSGSVGGSSFSESWSFQTGP